MEQAAAEPASEQAVAVTETRDKVTGQFKKGVSGNPNGRPPAARARIALNQALIEEYVRGRVPAKQVLQVVQETFKEAMLPGKLGLGAKKLVFEFFIQKPRDVETIDDKSNSVVIRIENATFKATHASDPQVIEGEVTEVTQNG